MGRDAGQRCRALAVALPLSLTLALPLNLTLALILSPTTTMTVTITVTIAIAITITTTPRWVGQTALQTKVVIESAMCSGLCWEDVGTTKPICAEQERNIP